MIVYDKKEIKEYLTVENIFDILQEFGGDPDYSSFGIVSTTICHNMPGEGSRKLYYYSNSGLFRCYTGCDDIFDLYQLIIKVMKIQHDKDFNLNDAVRWVAKKFGLSGKEENQIEEELEDWKYLANYSRIQEIELKNQEILLKEYDDSILDKFNYNVSIEPWIAEGISQNSIDQARIGFYPGGD